MQMIILRNVDRCVCCGEPVPEGTEVCQECIRQARDATKKVIKAFKEAVQKSEQKEAEKDTGPERRLLRYLKLHHTGKENAVYSKELEDRFDLGGRSLRRIINKLRQDGNPVCSNCKGYYYAENREDVKKTVRWLNDLVSGVSSASTGLLHAPVLDELLPEKITITIKVG